MSKQIDNSDLPAFDNTAEDPYPDGQLEAATIEWMLKAHRKAGRVVEQQWGIVDQPYNEETKAIASYFDRVWKWANFENLGSPPPHLKFELRGHYWEDDIGWADLAAVKIPSEDVPRRPPRVLETSVYSCKHCGYITKRADWFREHLRERHPKIDGPITRGSYQKHVEIGDGGASDSGFVPTTLEEYTNSE
jgi:hypothetical protein